MNKTDKTYPVLWSSLLLLGQQLLNTCILYVADGSAGQSPPWCRIAYWEKRELLNRDNYYPVYDASAQVFQDLPHASGLCLESVQDLSAHSPLPPDPGGHAPGEDVRSTRKKIGAGVILSHEENSVWVYNRGQQSVFVHSPTLELPESRTFRIESGHCVQAYDFLHRSLQLHALAPRQDGPVDKFSIKLSFVKGWGHGYSRTSILDCPCWLEILLYRGDRDG